MVIDENKQTKTPSNCLEFRSLNCSLLITLYSNQIIEENVNLCLTGCRVQNMYLLRTVLGSFQYIYLFQSQKPFLLNTSVFY